MTIRIAIVEDEPLILEVLKLFLESQGYVVYCFTNPHDAGSIINEEQIDLLICDVQLGDDNGIQFTKHCEMKGFTGAVLIISGFIPNTAEFHPSWHFLRKPFNRQSLLNEVNALVLPNS